MSRPFSRVGLAAASLTGLAVLGVQAPASADVGDCPTGQRYAPSVGCVFDDIDVSDRTLTAGETVTVTGNGFRAFSEVTLSIESSPVVITTLLANSAGFVETTFTFPASVDPGNHLVVLDGIGENGADLRLTEPILVVGSVGSGAFGDTGSGFLAQTGTDVAVVALAGLGLVGAGGGVVYAGRRRRVTV